MRPRAAAHLGLVTDRRRLAAVLGRPRGEAAALVVAQVEAAAALGLAFVQLREPDLDTLALWRLTRQVLEVAAGRTRILVNDRADVAAAAGAGLHLKHASLATADVREWLPPGAFVTRAVHGVDDTQRAGAVDAVVAGTAARTSSKPAGTPTLGPEGLAAIVAAATCPVFAIGGLGPADWNWVRDTGAFGVAGIGAFLPGAGETPEEAVGRAVSAFEAMID